jgi:hypothetical protein
MTTDEAVAYIESLGEELVPALRELGDAAPAA